MRIRRVHLASAVVASLGIHGLAAAWLVPTREEVRMSGGAEITATLVGDAFASALTAGKPSEIVQPIEPDAGRPVTQEAKTIRSTSPETTLTRDAPIVSERSTVVSVEPEAARPPTEDAVAPTVQATRPPLATADKAPIETATLQPFNEPERITGEPPVPIPVPRPADMPRPVPADPTPEARNQDRPSEKKAERPRKQVREQAGRGGAAESDTQRGAAERRSAERSREAGNAAVSNYPGVVARKLRRSLRYPADAPRKRLRGEVSVSFVVRSDGSAGSIRVARSSGHPVLDQAAIETVRRAAPFPPIPDGRNSWPFTVPIAFAR